MINKKSAEFLYTALDSSGRKLSGKMNASGAEQAREILLGRGLLLRNIKEARGSNTIHFMKKSNPNDFIRFISQFNALVRAGLTIPESLEQCMDRPGNPVLGNTLTEVYRMLNGGMPLSAALEKFPGLFDPVMLSAVKTGEASGDIVTPLTRYRLNLEKRIKISRKTKQALAYPLFILAVMILVLAGIFTFVMPKFVTLYADFDAELPAATRFLMFVGGNSGVFFILTAITAAIISFSAAVILTNDRLRAGMDRLILKLPVIGPINASLGYSAFASALNTLLAGGMPLAEAVVSASKTIKNRYYRKKVEKIYGRICSGETFAAACSAEEVFPRTAIKLLNAGEMSGSIDSMLDETAVYYEEEADTAITSMMSLIEPAMILITGIIVGSVIVIMYLPVFRLTEIIK